MAEASSYCRTCFFLPSLLSKYKRPFCVHCACVKWRVTVVDCVFSNLYFSAVNQTASAIPKTWSKPNDGSSAGDAAQKENEVLWNFENRDVSLKREGERLWKERKGTMRAIVQMENVSTCVVVVSRH